MKSRHLKIEAFMLLWGGVVHGQTATPPSVQQKAEKSVCSNIVALTGNVDIKCSALTPEQSKALMQIQSLLRNLVANKIDPNLITQMNDKLDELKRLESQPRPAPAVNIAPGGFATSGGTLLNPTVNNYGAPPATIQGFETVPSDPKADASGHPITSFRFYVSGTVPDQKFIVICDRPCGAWGAGPTPPPSVRFGGDIQTGTFDNEPTWGGWIINYPIHSGAYQIFSVVSRDSEPVNVVRFALGQFPIKPPQ